MKRFLSDRRGTYGVAMAVSALPILLSVGLAIDYSRQTSARRHLQEIADAASLALASSDETRSSELRRMAEEMIFSNQSPDRVEQVKISSLKAEDDRVDLRLDGSIPTMFMQLANISRLDVQASSLAERSITGGVEVALVLDNTDSMSYDGKIGTLKKAAIDLAEKLFEEEKADVRIGLVPYAEQINVGTRNRKASWLSVPDDYSKTTTTTTDRRWHQPQKRTNNCLKWKEAGSRRVEKDGIWVTETWGRSCQTWEMVDNGPGYWIPAKTTKTTTKYKWHGCIGSRIDRGKLLLHDQDPNVTYPGFVTKAKTCLTEVLPLTDDERAVTQAINGMTTKYDTYIPAGVVWGINVLSPTAPLTEGAAYEPFNKKPRKVMVLMTDGLNTKRVDMSDGDYRSASAPQRLQVNEDTATACNYAKAQKIEIFVVAFKVVDLSAKTMLRDCATDTEHYYDASDPDKLVAAFAGIARSLQQVRLAR